jgi:DNA polymerase-3 subunit gamma/tau
MKFQNKKVGFNIEVVEVPKEHVNSEATLTTREKYLRIVEQYPLVKELKEKLKLELDY